MKGESYESLLRELNEERAAALMRISRTLESLIEDARSLRERMAALPEIQRHRAAREYRDLRARAVKYRWYLEVQREALGLRYHPGLDEWYPIPEPLDGR